VGEPQTEPPSNMKTDTTNLPIQPPQSEQVIAANDIAEDHSGEDVVVAEEDTVIY